MEHNVIYLNYCQNCGDVFRIKLNGEKKFCLCMDCVAYVENNTIHMNKHGTLLHINKEFLNHVVDSKCSKSMQLYVNYDQQVKKELKNENS